MGLFDINTSTEKLGEIANSTSLLSFIQSTNIYLTDGWLGICIYFGALLIAFIGFVTTTDNPRKSFAGTGGLAFPIGLLLWMMGLITSLVFLIGFAGGIVTLIVCYASE